MTVRELLAEAGAALKRDGLPDPAREARWLLAHVLARSEAGAAGRTPTSRSAARLEPGFATGSPSAPPGSRRTT